MKSLVLFLAFYSTTLLFANDSDKSPTGKSEAPPFREGEELQYLLHYGPMKGGYATLQLRKAKYKNLDVFHARAYARSTGLTDKLFKVEDIYESYFDPGTCLPHMAIRDISEGGYKYYNEVEFNHAERRVISQKSGEIEVPEGILDMVSTLYYIRNSGLDTLMHGDVIHITTFFGDEIFPFPLRYKGKEKVKTRNGKIRCHRFDPVVEVGRIFESEDDMQIWISDDENMVPILVRFDMIVGAVKCELVNYKNLSVPLAYD